MLDSPRAIAPAAREHCPPASPPATPPLSVPPQEAFFQGGERRVRTVAARRMRRHEDARILAPSTQFAAVTIAGLTGMLYALDVNSLNYLAIAAGMGAAFLLEMGLTALARARFWRRVAHVRVLALPHRLRFARAWPPLALACLVATTLRIDVLRDPDAGQIIALRLLLTTTLLTAHWGLRGCWRDWRNSRKARRRDRAGTARGEAALPA